MKLEGKRAVVTGAGQGIGRAIARRLASEGAAVAVLDIDEARASAVASEIEVGGGRAKAYKLDVGDPEAAANVMRDIAADFGGIDILVNNAGIARDNLLIRLSSEDWDLVMRVNLTGVFNCTRAAVRTMMAQRYGRIVNVSSVIGLVGNVGQASYAASKAGIIAFTKTVAKEFASRGITANAIAPGFIETPMTERLPEKVRQDFMSRILLGRFGKAEEVANLVAFLVSDEADYLTGQTISIDGGMV
jgi:3-oxoacyl-[acyl-carrier protein] reductase